MGSDGGSGAVDEGAVDSAGEFSTTVEAEGAFGSDGGSPTTAETKGTFEADGGSDGGSPLFFEEAAEF